ncbi:hypothetical protein MHBO_000133 [Bonamia ostreae]|uniref:Secreted protein n=1 Tax=Bonamia ostreae TaxID=126728 RepID=A0ABV2AEJ3_9EUKA
MLSFSSPVRSLPRTAFLLGLTPIVLGTDKLFSSSSAELNLKTSSLFTEPPPGILARMLSFFPSELWQSDANPRFKFSSSAIEQSNRRGGSL